LGATALVPMPGRALALPTGPVQPRAPAPPVRVLDERGQLLLLATLLSGSVSAVQLMFTGCGTVCPAQGAYFARLAARPRPFPVRWLSISVDSLGDDASRLAAWLARFGAPPSWKAAVPGVHDLDRLCTYLRGAPASPSSHTEQVFVFDARGQLAYRTGDQPSAIDLERVLARTAEAA
jgi:protein SCO1/2